MKTDANKSSHVCLDKKRNVFIMFHHHQVAYIIILFCSSSWEALGNQTYQTYQPWLENRKSLSGMELFSWEKSGLPQLLLAPLLQGQVFHRLSGRREECPNFALGHIRII